MKRAFSIAIDRGLDIGRGSIFLLVPQNVNKIESPLHWRLQMSSRPMLTNVGGNAHVGCGGDQYTFAPSKECCREMWW